MSMCVILLLYVCPTYIDLNVYTTFHQFITPDCSYYTRYSNLTLCWTTIAGAGHIDPGVTTWPNVFLWCLKSIVNILYFLTNEKYQIFDPLMNGRIVLKQKNLLYVLCIQRTMLLFENKRFDRYLRQNSGLTLLIETGFKHC